MTIIAIVVTGVFFLVFAVALIPAMIAAAIEEKWNSGSRVMLLGLDSREFSMLYGKGRAQETSKLSGLALWPNSNQISPGFVGSISRAFVGWQDYSGRSTRSEFWWWYLFQLIVSLAIMGVAILIQLVDSGNGAISLFAAIAGFLSLFFSIATFLPSVALSIRRLHDSDRTGWWLLIFLLPVVGAIVLFVFFVSPSTKGSNRFGSQPFSGQSDEWVTDLKMRS